MISLADWLKNLSENYSVQHINDIDSGIFVANVTKDIYLLNHAEVKKCQMK